MTKYVFAIQFTVPDEATKDSIRDAILTKLRDLKSKEKLTDAFFKITLVEPMPPEELIIV